MRFVLALTFLAASVLPSTARAQAQVEVEESGGGPVLKPAIGLSWTDVTEDPQSGDTQAKAGWQVGATLLFGERLYFEGGVFYAKKSTDITAATASTNIDYQGVLGFRILLMVGLHLLGGDEGSLGLRLFGGGSAFIVTSVDAEGLSKSDFESPTYGVFAGVGVDFLFLFADLSYEWSLTDVSKVSTMDVGQSRSLFLSAGVRLPL